MDNRAPPLSKLTEAVDSRLHAEGLSKLGKSEKSDWRRYLARIARSTLPELPLDVLSPPAPVREGLDDQRASGGHAVPKRQRKYAATIVHITAGGEYSFSPPAQPTAQWRVSAPQPSASAVAGEPPSRGR